MSILKKPPSPGPDAPVCEMCGERESQMHFRHNLPGDESVQADICLMCYTSYVDDIQLAAALNAQKLAELERRIAELERA